MIKDDFEINPEKKVIRFNSKGSGKTYSVRELYSYLMDAFDEPENMKYDIPIVAKSKDEFELINGWTIDKNSLKYLKGGSLQIAELPKR